MTVLHDATRLSHAWRANGRVAAGRSDVRTSLAASLDREMATLNRLDISDPLYDCTTRHMVSPALRRFTYDQHLRDECRVLVLLREFCGRDLADSQGMETSEQLAALAKIKAAIQFVDRG